MGRGKAPGLPIKALSFCRPTELRGKGGGASHQRGECIASSGARLACFPSGEARLYGFRRQRRHKKMAPQRAPYLASAAVLYTSRGRSPQPVREASAGPGQNPWRPGPKARRRHQPSPAKAGVNLREYWKAPPKSRSRSRPRHRRLNPQAPKGALNLREYSFPRQSPLHSISLSILSRSAERMPFSFSSAAVSSFISQSLRSPFVCRAYMEKFLYS